MRRLAALVLACAVGACGLDADSGPRAAELSIPDAPLELPAAVTDEVPATIYLLSGAGELVPVSREVVATDSNLDHLRAALDALAGGPNATEVADGIRSAVPVTTTILDVAIDDGTATIDLSGSFLTIGGSTEVLAVGQIVVTAATHPGVQRVRLSVAGEAVAIPLPNGALSESSVELAQYASLLRAG